MAGGRGGNTITARSVGIGGAGGAGPGGGAGSPGGISDTGYGAGGGGGGAGVVGGAGGSGGAGTVERGGDGGQGGANGTIANPIGSRGADGLTSAGSNSGGGGGGEGGYGLVLGADYTNSAAISGGRGGDGGGGGLSGSGGDGGVGFFATSSLRLTNNGSITGGNGGTFGPTGDDFFSSVGRGGVGVVGSGLSVVNAGLISGGRNDAGNGVQADAIDFTGGTNRLTSNGAASFVGAVGIASGASLFLDQTSTAGGAGSFTYANAFTGAGALGINTGAGSAITLTGTNTYTGPTTVNAGTLLVDGSIVSSADVKSGGTLGGHGSTGIVTIEAGGTLSPGNSLGVLTTRDLTLVAGATLKEEIGGTAQGQFDQTKVIGTVALNGATLNLASFGSFVSARGNQFVIIDNDGTDAVQGTFAGLANGASLTLGSHNYQINYSGGDGNDVVLTDVTLPNAATVALFGTVVTSAASQTGSLYGLYQGLLGRAPDALGLEGYTVSLRTGSSLTDVAQVLLGSAERGAAVSDPTAYVQSLYSNTLHRSADSGGLAYYTGELNAGVSQATVAVQIATSTEAQSVNATTFQAGVFVPDAISSAVARLYYGVLGRKPDAGGLGSFEMQVKQAAAAGGVSGAIQGLAGVVNNMLASTEYTSTHAGQTNAAFVDSLFVGALGRHADASGSAFYVSELAQGVSQAQVALQIVQSTEAQVRLVGQIEVGLQVA